MSTRALTDFERRVLAIERVMYGRAWGRKEERVRVELGLSMTAYTQRLNAMLSDPRVEAAAPLDVRRLRRIRASRLAARAPRSG